MQTRIDQHRQTLITRFGTLIKMLQFMKEPENETTKLAENN